MDRKVKVTSFSAASQAHGNTRADLPVMSRSVYASRRDTGGPSFPMCTVTNRPTSCLAQRHVGRTGGLVDSAADRLPATAYSPVKDLNTCSGEGIEGLLAQKDLPICHPEEMPSVRPVRLSLCPYMCLTGRVPVLTTATVIRGTLLTAANTQLRKG